MNKRILLVEYASSTIEIISEMLSHPIFTITIVNEGDAAKQKLTEDTFDLLITAAMLPKFHGFNLSQYTAENYPDTRIVIISEIYKGMDYKHQAMTQYKADDFFEKPFDKETFKNRVFELLQVRDEDLSEDTLTEPIENPPEDTKKVPTMQKLEEEEGSKKMTSEDLFGDIIEAVQEGEAAYEIKLDGEPGKEDKSPEVPPVTQVLPKSKAKEIPKVPPKEEDMEDTSTRLLTVDEVQPDFSLHETKPEELMPETPESPQTIEIPVLTQEMKTPVTRPPASAATQKIDLELLGLIKSDKKEKENDKEKKKFKKIEEDISKKFEETLSGLGLGIDRKPPKPTPEEAEKKTEVIVQPEKKDEEKEDDMGGYDILGLIARGGMAEIYKAKKKGIKGFEKLIALKKILSGYGEDAKYIEMFVDEAKIAAELTHPNIVQIYDLGKKDDYYFIAMEYVSGKDLRDILGRLAEANTTMPVELAIYLILKILEALNYAHAARNSSGTHLEIVHRDISPPNILVSYDGNIKLTDFGVSKASIKMHHTVAGALKGKLLYMSPEQARGDSTIDFRSDLYSAGIILFEVLTGKKLFLDSSELGTLKKVQDGEVVKPSQIKKEIDLQLDSIILKALEKDIDKRYQKASDMIKALDTYMKNTFDNVPDSSHMAHFIYTLFKDEILKEKIEINLKSIPYSIKRKTKKAAEAEPEETPPPAPEPIQSEETTQPQAEQQEQKTAPEAPPEPTPDSIAEPEEESEILELTESEHMKEEVPKESKKSQQEFQPIIEISFDDDKERETPGDTEGTGPDKGTWKSPFSQFEALEEEEVNKKKRNLLIAAIAAILALIAIIVYFLFGSSSPDTSRPTGTVDSKISDFKAAEPDTVSPGIDAQPDAKQAESQPDEEKETLPSAAVKDKETEEKKEPGRDAAAPVKESIQPPQDKPTAKKPEVQAPSKVETQVPPRKTEKKDQKETPEKQEKVKKEEQKTGTEPPVQKEAETTTSEKSAEGEETKPAVPESTEETKEQPQVPEEKPEIKPEVQAQQKPQAEPALKEGDILSPSVVDVKPVPVSTPPIKLTRSIKRMMLSNQRVLVSYLIDHNGNVETVKLIQKSRMKKLNALIIETIKKWKFKPAVKNNIKVKVWKNNWITINK
jgi:TonB family protein